jgi:hypothetical protein
MSQVPPNIFSEMRRQKVSVPWADWVATRLKHVGQLMGLRVLQAETVTAPELAALHGDLLVWYRSPSTRQVGYITASCYHDLRGVEIEDAPSDLSIPVGSWRSGQFYSLDASRLMLNWLASADTLFAYTLKGLGLTESDSWGRVGSYGVDDSGEVYMRLPLPELKVATPQFFGDQYSAVLGSLVYAGGND